MRVRTEEKRRQILIAGEQLFCERRYDEITMDEVARLAGVGKGTLYRYFSGKEALLSAVLEFCHEDLVVSLRQVCGREEEFLQLLRDVGQELSRFQERRHPMMHLLFLQHQRRGGEGSFAASRRESFQRHCQELHEVVKGLMRRGVGEGFLRGDIPVERMAWMYLTLVRDWVHSRLHPIQSFELSLDEVLELFIKGVQK